MRGSNTDFNNNARGIQGGNGFATNVDGVDKTALVFNHGPTKGISDSLDAMSEWVATVRAPIMPAIAATAEAHGRARVRDVLRELPRRREVDQEPHERPVPGQSAAAGGPGRPGVLHRRHARTTRASTVAGPQVV